MRPFLKWAGGKYRVLSRIQAVLPSGARLVEPFCGSAAVALNVDYPGYVLNDVSAELTRLYRLLCEQRLDFIRNCETYFTPEMNTAEAFQANRVRYNETKDAVEKSALFVYLNRHSYNGLYRTNRTGGYNVPFGRYTRPYFPRREMVEFAERFQGAEFLSEDFEVVMAQAVPGDVVYADPPYAPLSRTANFTGYQAAGFGEDRQWALAKMAEALAGRGVTVVISNHDTEFTREMYRDAEVVSFEVQRTISCRSETRSRVRELLAVYRGS